MRRIRPASLARPRVGSPLRRLLAAALCVGACLLPASTASAMLGPEAPGSATARTRTSPAAPRPGREGGVPSVSGRDGSGPHDDGGPVAVDRSVPRARWSWPLAPRPAVLARFRAPSTAYGPGHRGVDLASRPGATVHAVAAGRVSFAGVIGGKPTVAVTHADGVRSTYEPVTARVATGDEVVVGQLIGLVTPTGSHCTTTCLHLGAVRVSTYLDPLRLLGWWRVRLLPLDQPS